MQDCGVLWLAEWGVESVVLADEWISELTFGLGWSEGLDAPFPAVWFVVHFDHYPYASRGLLPPKPCLHRMLFIPQHCS
jgi:hypothetical protein